MALTCARDLGPTFGMNQLSVQMPFYENEPPQQIKCISEIKSQYDIKLDENGTNTFTHCKGTEFTIT